MKELWKYLFFVGYLLTIVAANWAVQHYGIVSVGFGLAAPAAVFFAGLALTFRDELQEATESNYWIIAAILIGAGLSYFIAPTFAVASGAAFLLSEFLDFGIYSRIRQRSRYLGILVSNFFGSIVDSAVFLYLAFGSFTYLEGQVVGKMWVTAASIGVIYLATRIFLGVRQWRRANAYEFA